MKRTRPEIKVWRELKDSDEALSASKIQERTGMHWDTVTSVLEALVEMERIEPVKTSSTTHYKPKRAVTA